jgi:hypothetical protein
MQHPVSAAMGEVLIVIGNTPYGHLERILRKGARGQHHGYIRDSREIS